MKNLITDEELRNIVRAGMEKHGLSARDLSKRCDLGTNFVFQWLDNDKHSPRLKNVHKLLAVLDELDESATT